ncbi:MAG: hypothetical protein IPK50_22755 [Fibrobacterota bacterium]|nr:MAG: hypothetical protein IPK50_22755 [Fibrobacterota bacterium]
MRARKRRPWLCWPMPEIVGESASRTREKARLGVATSMEDGYSPATVFVLPASQDLREAIRASRPMRKTQASQDLSPRKIP